MFAEFYMEYLRLKMKLIQVLKSISIEYKEMTDGYIDLKNKCISGEITNEFQLNIDKIEQFKYILKQLEMLIFKFRLKYEKLNKDYILFLISVIKIYNRNDCFLYSNYLQIIEEEKHLCEVRFDYMRAIQRIYERIEMMEEEFKYEYSRTIKMKRECVYLSKCIVY